MVWSTNILFKISKNAFCIFFFFFNSNFLQLSTIFFNNSKQCNKFSFKVSRKQCTAFYFYFRDVWMVFQNWMTFARSRIIRKKVTNIIGLCGLVFTWLSFINFSLSLHAQPLQGYNKQLIIKTFISNAFFYLFIWVLFYFNFFAIIYRTIPFLFISSMTLRIFFFLIFLFCYKIGSINCRNFKNEYIHILKTFSDLQAHSIKFWNIVKTANKIRVNKWFYIYVLDGVTVILLHWQNHRKIWHR